MAPAFVNHVKARTRSVQLGGGVLQSLAPNSTSLKGDLHQPGKRTSSLGIGLENAAAVSLESLCPIRRYRSMLEVEDPPTLQAVEPLTYDELYPRKLDIEPARMVEKKLELDDFQDNKKPIEPGHDQEDSQNGSC